MRPFSSILMVGIATASSLGLVGTAGCGSSVPPTSTAPPAPLNAAFALNADAGESFEKAGELKPDPAALDNAAPSLGPVDLKDLRQAIVSFSADTPGFANSPKTERADGYLTSDEIRAAVKQIEGATMDSLSAPQKKQREVLLAFLSTTLAAEAKGDARGAPYMRAEFYDYAKGLDSETISAAIRVDALLGDNDGLVSRDEEAKIAQVKLRRRQDEMRVHCGPPPAAPLRSK